VIGENAKSVSQGFICAIKNNEHYKGKVLNAFGEVLIHLEKPAMGEILMQPKEHLVQSKNILRPNWRSSPYTWESALERVIIHLESVTSILLHLGKCFCKTEECSKAFGKCFDELQNSPNTFGMCVDGVEKCSATQGKCFYEFGKRFDAFGKCFDASGKHFTGIGKCSMVFGRCFSAIRQSYNATGKF
jgi:hypothetical protein